MVFMVPGSNRLEVTITHWHHCTKHIELYKQLGQWPVFFRAQLLTNPPKTPSTATPWSKREGSVSPPRCSQVPPPFIVVVQGPPGTASEFHSGRCQRNVVRRWEDDPDPVAGEALCQVGRRVVPSWKWCLLHTLLLFLNFHI